MAISAGCAPPIDGPIEHQRAIDRDDGDRLAAQLAQLPGVVSASVVLHHAMRDPLAVTPPAAATFSAVIATDDLAEPDVLRAATVRLARAALPELPGTAAPAIEIHITNIEKRGYGSVTSEAAIGMIAGFGVDSYVLALEAMVARLRREQGVTTRLS